MIRVVIEGVSGDRKPRPENEIYERWRASESLSERQRLEKLLFEFVRSHARSLCYVILRRLEPFVVEDAACRVIGKLESFVPDRALFSTFAHKIIKDTVYYQRRVDRRHEREISVDVPGFDLGRADSMEYFNILRSAQEVLTPEEFQLFEMSVLEGMTDAEIAEKIHLSRPYTSKKIRRVIEVLKNALTKRLPARSRS